MNWQISYFNATLQQELLDWPTGLQARYIRLTDMMLAYDQTLECLTHEPLPPASLKYESKRVKELVAYSIAALLDRKSLSSIASSRKLKKHRSVN